MGTVARGERVLTYQGSPRNALEAVLAASRPTPTTLLAGSTPNEKSSSPARTRVAVDRAAVALLARVLAYRPSHGPPIIQIACCSDFDTTGGVAATLARTCAVLVGRTLMVELEPLQTGLFTPPATAGPLPDAFLGGLYHHRIGMTAADADLLYGPMRAQALASLASPFRILVADTAGPNNGATLALAPLCHCTVLVVQAGRTRVTAVTATAAIINHAGGRVVGTVFAGGNL